MEPEVLAAQLVQLAAANAEALRQIDVMRDHLARLDDRLLHLDRNFTNVVNYALGMDTHLSEDIISRIRKQLK